MDIPTKEVHMFFFKPTPEKVTKWFNEGILLAKFNGRDFTDELRIEINQMDNGYQVAIVDGSISEDYEIPHFYYDKSGYDGRNRQVVYEYAPVKIKRVLYAFHIDFFTKKSIMIAVVSDALYDLERRKSLIDEANKMSDYCNAGFNIVTTQHDFYSTTSILLLPKEVDSYVKFCQKYMETRIETGYPFDAIAFRADLIDQFAHTAATHSNDSDMVICGTYPPIVIDTVIGWYKRYVERKKREESIALINSTCQKTVDQIQARYRELTKSTPMACGARTRHAG